MGADFEIYTLVSAELGRWYPPTALTFNMHACTTLWSSQSAAKQLVVAEMRLKLEQAKALFFQTIKETDPRPTKEARLRAYITQWTVMEYANDIDRLGLRICVGRALFKHFDIERWYRDSCCGSLMLPWTAEICLERLGYEILFEKGER